MFYLISKFFSASVSGKIHYLNLAWERGVTQLYYKLRLKSCGMKSSVGKPLFWAPEQISIGDDVYIYKGCRIQTIVLTKEKKIDSQIIIGDRVTFQQNCHITAASTLIIGSNTTVSFGVSIQDTDHKYTELDVNILKQSLIIKRTQIGEYCFIGSGAKIQAGTILGKQCIIGTNAVVRGIFPDYCVIVGVPARIIKRYNPKTKQWEKTNKEGEFLSEI